MHAPHEQVRLFPRGLLLTWRVRVPYSIAWDFIGTSIDDAHVAVGNGGECSELPFPLTPHEFSGKSLIHNRTGSPCARLAGQRGPVVPPSSVKRAGACTPNERIGRCAWWLVPVPGTKE
jgi:hypothetical protein